MAVLTAGFNPTGATNGASIATSDAGDLTAWNAVTHSGGTFTYDNTHTLFGKSLAGNFAAAGVADVLTWSTAYGTQTEEFGRLYLYMSGLPSANSMLVSTGGPRIRVNTTGTVSLMNGASTVVGTSTTVLATGQWYRLEWHWLFSTTVGTADVRIYTSPDSTTVAETISGSALNLGASNSSVVFGVNSNATWTGWLAQIADLTTTWPGPFPVNTVAPAVSGSSTVGSTLTCDGGTWNDTFTLGYQWTSNGTNIAAATSSTYVTQAGDAGNAIGCTVTATGVRVTNESATKASSNTITVGASSTSRLALSSHPGRFLRQKGIR